MLTLLMQYSSDKLSTRLFEDVNIAEIVDAVEGAKVDFGILPLLAFTGMVISLKLFSEPVWLMLMLLMYSSSDKLLARMLVDNANDVDAIEGCKADFGFLPL